uniref:uncharacterized protein LOC120812881 n=1 Tax=Gasterosteus aculeatus aculeatus TaxID=481459 RepID=UPI001A98144E|nr:uncharacterized protein LOC120812881 [Gasterosteus aculeatus aculeatus]
MYVRYMLRTLAFVPCLLACMLELLLILDVLSLLDYRYLYNHCPGPEWNIICRGCCEYDVIRCKCPLQGTPVGYAVPCCRNAITECDPCIIHPGLRCPPADQQRVSTRGPASLSVVTPAFATSPMNLNNTLTEEDKDRDRAKNTGRCNGTDGEKPFSKTKEKGHKNITGENDSVGGGEISTEHDNKTAVDSRDKVDSEGTNNSLNTVKMKEPGTGKPPEKNKGSPDTNFETEKTDITEIVVIKDKGQVEKERKEEQVNGKRGSNKVGLNDSKVGTNIIAEGDDAAKGVELEMTKNHTVIRDTKDTQKENNTKGSAEPGKKILPTGVDITQYRAGSEENGKAKDKKDPAEKSRHEVEGVSGNKEKENKVNQSFTVCGKHPTFDPERPAEAHWPWLAAIYRRFTNRAGTKVTKADGQAGSPKVDFEAGTGSYDGAAKWQLVCSGALVNQKRVLVAAHCVIELGKVYPLDAAELKVVVGKHSWDDRREDKGPQHLRVASVVVHPNYDPHVLDSDIAVVKLLDKAKVSEKVLPLCLSDLSAREGEGRARSPCRRGSLRAAVRP